jgi:hypothetical protein
MNYTINADTTIHVTKVYSQGVLEQYQFNRSGRTSAGWMLRDIELVAIDSKLKLDPFKTQDTGYYVFSVVEGNFDPDLFEAKIVDLAKLYEVNMTSQLIEN